ncbi:MAG: DUF5522 domain-containing protein [Parafilimonas sp.]
MNKRLTEDDDYFFSSDGLVVFTKEYLLERGYCCGNGCVNCPYDYKMVPEPKRTMLLEKRKQKMNDEL